MSRYEGDNGDAGRAWLGLLSDASTSTEPTERCPTEGAWGAMVEGLLPERTRRRMVDHLARCDECARLWSHLVEVVSWPSGIGGDDRVDASPRGGNEPDDPPSSGTPGAGRRGWIATAAIIVLVALAIPFILTPVPSPDRLRSPATSPVLDLQVVPGDADEGPTLSWSPWPGADSYRVRLWDGNGETVLDVTVPAGRNRLSPRLDGSQFDGPDGVVGVVEALAEGEVVATADVFELPVRRGPDAAAAADEARRRRDLDR